MFNFIYIVLIFLFLSIMLVSNIFYFRYRKWKWALITLIFTFITVFTTIHLFLTRDARVENEFEVLWNGVINGNVYCIFTLVLQVLLVVFSVVNYVKVLNLRTTIKKFK